MNIHNLDPIFQPRRIALVGVTINPNGVGGKVLTNLIGSGFRGVVYPVNAESEAVMGVPCFPSVSSLPKIPDLAVICTPAEQVPGRVRECGAFGIRGVIIMSAGFKETGQAGRLLEEQIRSEAARFDRMRILGPNCLGFIAPGLGLNVSFALGMPKAGHVAFISQSGALCASVLDWAMEGKIGFSYFVSIGNTIDVDFGDLIDYFGEDDSTKSIILYIESIAQARRFMTAARAFAKSKPILAIKAGRFPESAEVAASHTGAMAAEDAVYDAAFQRAGLARVFEMGDVFDCAELIGRNKNPRGPRLAIVTNAGGPGVLATDALIAEAGQLASFTADTMLALNENLPPSWSHRNPVDVLGNAGPKRVERAVQIVLKDQGVDAVLVILSPQAMTNPTAVARALGELSDTTPKPILAAWLGGKTMREGISVLKESGIAAYDTPEQAVRAFMTLVAYSRNLEILYETPRDVPIEFSFNREEIRSRFLSEHVAESGIISEDESKWLIDAYGIATTRAVPARTSEEAVRIAGDIGYPVVLKVHSPDISHKSDVNGVALNLENEDMVRGAFDSIIRSAQTMRPDARELGVTVQPMINTRNALELILGIKKDAVFGTVMMVGMGGTGAELLRDRSLGFPPLNERLAMRMLESLRIWPLLNGYRGRPRADVSRLVEVMIRLSYLAADFPEIKELDINPLLVSPEGSVALDARILLDLNAVGKEAAPFSHLVLQPYPEKYVRPCTLKDGSKVLLRPIKPEDEPLWMSLLASCSKESIYSRFRYQFHWATHDVAIRFCYIDYDREIAIVAETIENGERRLVGVGRLIAEPGNEVVEYAILITDTWQHKELGSILTDYCLEIAQKWNPKRVVAQTTTDNRAMISIFQKRGFEIRFGEDSTVDVVKEYQ